MRITPQLILATGIAAMTLLAADRFDKVVRANERRVTLVERDHRGGVRDRQIARVAGDDALPGALRVEC